MLYRFIDTIGMMGNSISTGFSKIKYAFWTIPDNHAMNQYNRYLKKNKGKVGNMDLDDMEKIMRAVLKDDPDNYLAKKFLDNLEKHESDEAKKAFEELFLSKMNSDNEQTE